nr:hypothetical protein [Rhizobium leguminosarum]
MALASCATSAAAQQLCPMGSGEGVDPRVRSTADGSNFFGLPDLDYGQPDTAALAVWEAGAASWSHKAAVRRSGAVRIEQRGQAGTICLRSPHPVAYGRFGAEVRSAGRRLVVLEGRSGRVYLFDLQSPENDPLQLVETGAQSVAMTDTQVFVGGDGAIRVFDVAKPLSPVEVIFTPPAMRTFSGQIAVEDDLLVWTNGGLSLGDAGPTGPGRIEVFRRAGGAWRWQARLASDQTDGEDASGQSCCVEIDQGQIVVSTADGARRFAFQGGRWIEERLP